MDKMKGVNEGPDEPVNHPVSDEVLHRLLDKLEVLEKAVETASGAVQQGQGVAAMMADTADEYAATAQAAGVDIDARLKQALTLADKLTEPRTVAGLTAMLDRLDQFQQMADMADQAPAFAAMAADVVDEVAGRAQQRGIDLDQRFAQGLELVGKLTAPATMRVLSTLVDRMDQVEGALNMLDQLPGFISMVADLADELVERAERSGINVDARLRSTFSFGEKLTAPETVEAFNGVLDPGAVAIVGMAGRTLIRCRDECLSQEEPPEITPWGLVRALRDPDAQRSLAFLTNFARFFGQGMLEIHAQARAERLAAEQNGMPSSNQS